MLFNWTRWFARKNSPARKPKRSRRRLGFLPRVEMLESRIAPATLSVLEQAFGVSTDGSRPTGGLIADSSGDLFGTNSWGGAYGAGTVFELVPSGGSYTLNTLVSFNGTDGAYPSGPLLADSSGDLFGTTSGTASENGVDSGTVFELVNSGGSYTLKTLVSFNGSQANTPSGGLLMDSSDNIFGTTFQGNNAGAVFELANNSGNYTLNFLHTFGGTDGQAPNGALVADSSGDIFGTTQVGGANNEGTVFELANNSGSFTFSTLVNFDLTNGARAMAGLMVDSSGDLFGTTSSGGTYSDGTVFELVNSSGSYTLNPLVSFNNTDGANPTSGLIRDSSGDLFGTTHSGSGANAWGTAFELVNNSGSYTLNTLFAFNPNNGTGAVQSGSLLEDSNGNFFGTDSWYGAKGEGTAFDLVNNGGSYTYNTLAAFSGGTGRFPMGSLVADQNGDLFGTTLQGGATSLNSNEGTIFELVNSGGSYSFDTLFSFNGMDGFWPRASLIVDGSGDLFGTTRGGGQFGNGTVFELVNRGGSYSLSTLVSFNSTDGADPAAGLMADNNGDFFGTTRSGGAYNDGTVFELVNNSGIYTLNTLFSFNGTNGAYPQSTLIADSSGDLFGTTSSGGADGKGTVFELVNNGSSYSLSTLVSFNSTNGASPQAGLIADSNGDLFGTTLLGGSGSGTVFELVKSSGSYTLVTLVSFNWSNGAYPFDALIADSGGDLFGTTSSGGANGHGTVFELVNSDGSYTLNILVSFNGTDGAHAEAGLIADSSGSNLFGTTQYGGANGNGSVFEVHRGQTIGMASGNNQTSTVGTTLSSPLVVKVTDENGNPVSGITVHWAATAGGSVGSSTSVTDSNGDATITATLGTAAGSDSFTATVVGLTGSPVTFTATATAAPAKNETLVSGDNQTGMVGTELANPLIVQITDQYGNPVSGDTVNWAAATGGGSVSGATSVTDASGDASINATFGKTPGSNTFTATVAGLTGSPVTFTATGIAPQQTIGIFDPSSGNWYLRNSNSSGAPNIGPFAYGAPGWYPITGDWNGDGLTTIGVVDPSTETWYLRNSNSPGAPSYTPFQYGPPGWIPVVGDWNGSGHTGIGVFDPSTGNWYLRNEVGPGAPNAGQFQYGGTNWKPVVGDWTGLGKDTIGVVDPSTETWYLRNSNSGGAPDITPFAYGAPGWSVVAGDWTGTGHSGIGVFAPSSGTWYLRNEVGGGAADAGIFAYGGSNWKPLAGDWDFPLLPQLAAGGEAAIPSGAALLTVSQLQTEVQAALNLLASDGVNSALVAQLGSLQFTVGQLPAGTLGLSDVATGQVEISADAAGYGWFVDANPLSSVPANRMDLLTVVLHEMGHFDGWTELDPATHPDALMALTLGTGQRRTQDIDAVFAAGL